MPTIARLNNCTVTMYANDHLPPHFHVRMRDGREALVEIKTLSIISSSLKPSELKDALKWAAKNTSLLEQKWNTLNP